MFNNNFDMARGTTCGMATTEGVFTGGQDSMIPLKKFHDGPDLPPRVDLYMTPRTPPNAYESSDSYIRMNPARTAILSSHAPPPEYDACSSFKMSPDSEKLYAEIPGEYLPFYTGEQAQYGNIPDAKLQLQHAEDSNKGHESQDAAETSYNA